jgi:hypothetical protein
MLEVHENGRVLKALNATGSMLMEKGEGPINGDEDGIFPSKFYRNQSVARHSRYG